MVGRFSLSLYTSLILIYIYIFFVPQLCIPPLLEMFQPYLNLFFYPLGEYLSYTHIYNNKKKNPSKFVFLPSFLCLCAGFYCSSGHLSEIVGGLLGWMIDVFVHVPRRLQPAVIPCFFILGLCISAKKRKEKKKMEKEGRFFILKKWEIFNVQKF